MKVDNQQNQTLKITEIFYSLQGEARYSGVPTVFVRLTGCPMRCVYCDSAYKSSVMIYLVSYVMKAIRFHLKRAMRLILVK